LGVEWERKGGDITLAAFNKLQEKKMDASLHIIGCVPPNDISAEKNITVIPFLDKNKEEDFMKLHKIFLDTDFLLLPTRAECAGVVFSEASAYGIPSITTDTGGVSTYVKNGINGFTLPYNADGAEYANIIAELYHDKEKFTALKQSSRHQYDTYLNWELWGQKFTELAAGLIKK
jgi:glycosyltransferase involved in cell wall biosynthesis